MMSIYFKTFHNVNNAVLLFFDVLKPKTTLQYENKVFFSLRFVGEIQVGDTSCRMRKL